MSCFTLGSRTPSGHAGRDLGQIQEQARYRAAASCNRKSDMTSFFDKVLHDPGSAVRKSAGKPWWQTAKTTRQGFMAAALFGLLGLAALLTSVFGWAYLWVAAVVWLPSAGVHLVSAVALHRRMRAASASQTNPPPSSR